MKLQTFFFFPTTNTWKNILQCSVAGLKIGNSSFLPRLWLLQALAAWVRSLKGTWNLYVTQANLPSMQQGSADVTLVYVALQEGGWVVWFSRRIMRCSRVTWVCWESGSYPWAVFPLPALMVSVLVGRADMFDTIMRKAPDLLNSLCSASPVIESHETGLQEMGGTLPWGLNEFVRSREESMAAGSLWFLGGYLSYWERRRKKILCWSLEKCC